MDSGISPDPDKEETSNEMCVPLESLSIEGTAPKEGDMVTVEARVTRVENDMAYVEPVSGTEEEAAPDNEPPSFSDSGDYKMPM